MRYFIRGARIVGAKGLRKGNILIEDGTIASLGSGRAPKGVEVVEADGLLALPGFVDLHVHGGMGFDATAGVYDPKTGAFDGSPKAYAGILPKLMKTYARNGVTRALLATTAAPLETLENACACLADYGEGDSNGHDGARLEGVFPEGTFIRNPAFSGAQNPKDFLTPSIAVFKRLQKAARGTIRYINVAPEYGKDAEKVTRHATAAGVTVGMAHTSCPADQVMRCVKNGLRICQHFLNGPTGHSFKPFNGGNAIEAVLSSPELYAELICDGYHVNPRYVLDVVRRKGMDRVAVVTDAMFPTGLKDVKDFTLAGIAGSVSPDGEYLQVKGKENTLFGSVLRMNRGFANMVSWLTGDLEGIWCGARKPMPLEKALVQTARSCCGIPAGLIGLDKSRGVGALAKGRCADVALASLTGKPGKYALSVKHTFVAGRKVV